MPVEYGSGISFGSVDLRDEGGETLSVLALLEKICAGAR